MAQTAFDEVDIFEPETSGHQHPRTEISQNVDLGVEFFRNVETSAAVTTPPHHPSARTSQSAVAHEAVFLAILFMFAINHGSFRTAAHLLLLTFTRVVAVVVAIIILSLAMFTSISRGFILIFSRGFMLILSCVSHGFILILDRGLMFTLGTRLMFTLSHEILSHESSEDIILISSDNVIVTEVESSSRFMLILSRVSHGLMLILSRFMLILSRVSHGLMLILSRFMLILSRVNHGLMLILSRFMLILNRVSHGLMLILSREILSRESCDDIILVLNHGSSDGVIVTDGVSSSPAEISSAPEVESSVPTNAATASYVPVNAAPVNAATASVPEAESSAPMNADESSQGAFAAVPEAESSAPMNADESSQGAFAAVPEAESSAPTNANESGQGAFAAVPEAESSAPMNADESSQGAFAAAIAAVNAVADRKQLMPIIISVLGTFISIVAATLMLDKDFGHSIRDLGLAVFYLQVLAMICLLAGMGIKQLLGIGIKQQLRQLLFVVGIVMASVSVLFMVVFISLVFIVASKKK